MSEFHRLRAYLERQGTFTEEEFAFLEPLFLPRTLRAGEFLQRAGDGVTHGAFVATGCLRKCLGRPVVWTCREDDKDKLHFDTRQFNHVIWTMPDDLRT